MESNEEKFKAIFSDYQQKIFRLCCSYVIDPDAREDLYQNILIRIWKGLPSFNGQSTIGVWIYRISVNTAIDFLRKNQRDKKFSQRLENYDFEIIDRSCNSEELLLLTEKIRHLFKCINRLDFMDRTIISLYLEDISYKNIAEIVGLTEKYVGVKISRIKKEVNKCLAGY